MIRGIFFWKKTGAVILIGALLIMPGFSSLAHGLPHVSEVTEKEMNQAAPENFETPPSLEEARQKIRKTNNPFIKNYGQVEAEEVKFYSNIFSGTVFIQDQKITYKIREKRKNRKQDPQEQGGGDEKAGRETGDSGYVFNEVFDRTNEDLAVIGKEPSATEINFFGEKNHRSGPDSFGSLKYDEVWKNIDVVLEAGGQNVEKKFFVKPAGRPEDILMRVEGIDGLSVSDEGELVLGTSIGEIRMTAPVAYQDENGSRTAVDVSYRISADDTYSFVVGDYDRTKVLVIDPLLAGTSFASGDYMEVLGIKTDSENNIYAAGYTDSPSFPTTVGAYDTAYVSYNGYISKFDSNMTTLLASTFLGNGSLQINDILIDSSQNIIVAGNVSGAFLPTTAGAYDQTHNGGSDGFVSIFNSSLNTLLYSTYIGGSSTEYVEGISLDSGGNIFITGSSSSLNYPTIAGSYDTSKGASYDIVVSKFNPTLSSLLASTFLGAGSSDNGYRVRIDNANKVFVYGTATGVALPAGAYQATTYDASTDPIIARFNNTLTTLEAGTYLGGNSYEEVYGMIIDPSGNIIISGSGRSTFPTTEGAYDRTHNGGNYDFFLSIFNNSLSSLTASTLFGGNDEDWYFFGVNTTNSLALDSAGNIFFGGTTGSHNYPVTSGSFDDIGPTLDMSGTYAVVSKFSPNLSNLLVSTFFGGNGYYDQAYEQGGTLHIDSQDNVIMGGLTMNGNISENFYFPVSSNAYSKIFINDYEGFLVKLDNNLSAQTDHLNIKVHDVLDEEGFEGSVSLPSGFTTGGAANWEVSTSLYEEESQLEDFARPLYAFGPSPAIVFTNDMTGYIFFVRSTSPFLAYRKTIDGGKSWSGPVTVNTSVSGWVNVAVWYDRWTPGDTTGNLIHIAAVDSISDDVFYTYLDTADDSLAEMKVALAGIDFATFISGPPSIVKSAGNNLFISCNFASFSGSPGGAVAKSEDAGATWTPFNAGWSTVSIDQVQLLPLKTGGNVMAIRADTANNEIDYQIYDESSDSWAGAWTSVAPLVENTTLDQWFSATIKKSTGDVYLTLANYTDNAGNDVELWFFDEDAALPGWTKKTDLFTNNVSIMMPVPVISETEGRIYVAYLKKLTGTTWYDLHYKTSDDEGSTWSAESVRQNFSAQRFMALHGNVMTESSPFIAAYRNSSGYGIVGNILTNDPADFIYSSAKSGDIADSQSTYLKTAYNFPNGGAIKFRWRASIEGGPADMGFFCVDNEANCDFRKADYVLNDFNNWQYVTYELGAGNHEFIWKYVKDASFSSYEDAIWVDSIQFIEPAGQRTVAPGAKLTVEISADDAARKTYRGYHADRQVTFSGASSLSGTPTCTDKSGNEIAFGDPTTLTFINGRASCDIKLFTVETASIDISDGYFTSLANPAFGIDITVSGEASPVISPENSSLDLSPSPVTVGNEVVVTLSSYDTVGNAYVTGGQTVIIMVAGANSGILPVTDNGDGTYSAAYTPMFAGTDQISATIGGTAVGRDTDGNSDGIFSLTVNSVAGPGDPGDGGSGIPGPTEDGSDEDEENEEDHITLISSKNKELQFDVKIGKNTKVESDPISDKDDEGTQVKKVSIETKKEEKIDGKFKIKNKKEKPAGVIFPEIVEGCTPFQLIDVDPDFSDKKVKKAKIYFRIPEGWLKKFDLDYFVFVKGDKILQTLPGRVEEKNKWAVLLSSLINKKRSEYIYQVSSDSLEGWWGVYGCQADSQTPETENEVVPEAPAETVEEPGIIEEVVTPPPYVEKDVDGDGGNEKATDANNDPSDGFEEYSDPDNSTGPYETIDGDGDAYQDHLIDADGDGTPDIYWDPDSDVVSPVIMEDVDDDGTDEIVFGVQEEKPDRFYDPDDKIVRKYPIEDTIPVTLKKIFTRAKLTFIRFRPELNAIALAGLALPLASLFMMLSGPRGAISLLRSGFSGLLAFLTWRRKDSRDWGIVYDVHTGKPIPLATVQIINHERGKLAETKVTDRYGAFYFLVPPGSYRLEAIHKGYEAVKNLAADVVDSLYGNTYDFKPFNVKGYDRLNMDVAMKKSGFQPFALFLNKKNSAIFLNVLFLLGFFLSALMTLLNPSLFNIIVIILYIYVAVLRNMTLGRVKWGRIIDESGEPVAFSAISLFDEQENLVARTISDEKGRYFLIAEKGRYMLKVITPGGAKMKKLDLQLDGRGSIKEKIRM